MEELSSAAVFLVVSSKVSHSKVSHSKGRHSLLALLIASVTKNTTKHPVRRVNEKRRCPNEQRLCHCWPRLGRAFLQGLLDG